MPISPILAREFFDAVLAVCSFIIAVLAVCFYGFTRISHGEVYRCISGLPKRSLSDRERHAMLRWYRM